ncbi:lipid A deacylase LpxR family protein [Aeromonas sp. XH]|uniref:lipid A deacylase LpxR family protein n=1 Tax=Aeromonas sp. XH TaxID=3081770 RepID=UPI002966A633|nr:lipid A deacylase LpxR family protein [Aeromonas sp. XH]WOX50221.1 lipid A deacylase LpxR family protein [Aeromonas sp. XH]
MNKGRTALMLTGLLLSGASQAGDGTLTLTVENDVFTGSDNNYTNGVGIAWVSEAIAREDDDPLGQWTRFWAFLPFVADEGYTNYASWALAQEINTPDDIGEPHPDVDDQPYSGVLVVDSTLYARRWDWNHAWQLRLGVVGPASQADDTQREFHRLIGADKPQGWDTLLPNEPVVNLNYTVAHLAAAGHTAAELEWRLVPLATAGVGNYFTGAGVGLYGEIGWDLVDALGVTALRSGLNAASTVGIAPQNRWSVSLFGGGGAYGVVHYLPLDGTLFRTSHAVDTEPVIGMGSFGFCLRRGKLTLGFARTFFTETFDTQREQTDFGTLSLSWVL